jgi:hypothetical protein
MTEASSPIELCLQAKGIQMSRQAAVVVLALVLGATPLHAQVTLFTITTASADLHQAPSTGSPVI